MKTSHPTSLLSATVMVALVLTLGLAACAPEQRNGAAGQPERLRLRVGEVLGGAADSTDFRRALAPRSFSFPRDHAAHPDFRNEWWYLTGNLRDGDGRRYGYQLTFFSTAVAPETADEADSAWRSKRIWMAHAALTDMAGERHIALERFSRENPGLAGAQLEPFRVWLENWSLSAEGGGFPWRLRVEDPAFGLSLDLRAEKAPVPQGVDGLSRKSAEPGNASYYYSLTRLSTAGEIRLDGRRLRVQGDSWLDREWSTSVLAPDQSGWDWFSLQLDSGEELMYYQLRERGGGIHPYSQGNLTSVAGRQRLIEPGDMALEPLERWTSPGGTTYATAWRMEYGGRRWIIRALLQEQWMDVSVAYWEGAVEVLDADSGEAVGHGYLEMVRD